jgi:hypothetical protein
VEAARQAVEVTRRQLFPFRLELWLPLAFLAFLDQCGRTGGFGGPPAPGGGGGRGTTDELPDLGAATDWLGENVGTVVLVSAVLLTLIVGVVALVLWINSRGIFMYLDAVARGRADIARPWREHADRAGSLFAWRFGLAAAGLLLSVVVVAVVVLGAFGVRDGRVTSGVALGVGLLLLLPLFGLAMLALALVSVALRDFVAPLQMRHDLSCGAGLELFIDLLKANPGSFVGYILLKLLFAVTLGVAGVLVGCATCCLGFLPVVMQTLLQPAFYFERAWSLCLLRQAGHDVLGAPEAPSGELDSLRPAPRDETGPAPLPEGV